MSSSVKEPVTVIHSPAIVLTETNPPATPISNECAFVDLISAVQIYDSFASVFGLTRPMPECSPSVAMSIVYL